MERYINLEPLPSDINEELFMCQSNDDFKDPCILKKLECVDHPHATGTIDSFIEFHKFRLLNLAFN